jgi:predicted nucleotidyltransferase
MNGGHVWAPEWEADVFMVIWERFRYSPFTTKNLANVATKDKDQLRVALSRLVRRGWLIRLGRGRYLAKPLGRIMTSLKMHSVVRNALVAAGVDCPVYLHGSAADLLASEGSDIDLLVVSSGGWDEIERKLPYFHLTFVTPEHLRNLDNFFIYLVFRRGVPLSFKVEVADISFDPRDLLKEALRTWETAEVDGKTYGPQLLDAAGLAAKYLLYEKGMLPPTSSIGAIFELVKLDEVYLEAFRKLEEHRIEDVSVEVMEWAKRTE